MANEINHDFWRAFKKAVKEEKDDIFPDWRNLGRFNDMVDGRSVRFNNELYIFLYMQRIFAKKIISVSQFDQKIHRMNLRYPEMVTRAQMNFFRYTRCFALF